MIHIKDNCHGDTKFKHTEICSICVLHDHYDFKKALTLDLPARNDLYQKVLDGLKSGRTWRVQGKPNHECGHPGVRNTQGKCVFCITEAKMKVDWSKPVKSFTEAPGESEALRQNIATIKALIADLNAQLETMTNALTLSQMGLTTGIIKIKSPRQQAIAEGKKWYIPYEPCKHCHIIAERYVANGKCRNCGS